jgi:anti-anti-sigma factor
VSKIATDYFKAAHPRIDGETQLSSVLILIKDVDMSIENWSEEITLVDLVKEPDMGGELQTVIGMVTSESKFNVVVDFSEVDIVSSSSIAKLLKLRKVLKANGNHLVISSVNPATMRIFDMTGLNSVFDFVEDKFVALAGLPVAV